MNESDKKCHINNFKTALLNVAPEYFGVPCIENRIQYAERAFAYELYHQLRQKYKGNNWYVNGELRKGLMFLPVYKKDNTLIPDLVIHKHETTSQNIIAVEIKSNPKVSSSEIIGDLTKLEIYTRHGDVFLDYQIGIFLIINSDFQVIFNKMKKKSREKVFYLLSFHRIAIWNIYKPIPFDNHGVYSTIKPECLKIFRFNDLKKL